jgi:hypothetical protein
VLRLAQRRVHRLDDLVILAQRVKVVVEHRLADDVEAEAAVVVLHVDRDARRLPAVRRRVCRRVYRRPGRRRVARGAGDAAARRGLEVVGAVQHAVAEHIDHARDVALVQRWHDLPAERRNLRARLLHDAPALGSMHGDMLHRLAWQGGRSQETHACA